MENNLQIYNTLNILCVEDDENILEVYKEMFSLIFQNVHFAKDGAEGYEVFLQEDVDIVLTDYNMPRLNGLEMSEKIRQKDKTVPIILVTAFENLEMLRRAIDINIAGFIKKPLSAQSMFNTLEFVAKSILADRLLIKEQSKKIEYSSFQENLTWRKEQRIIKNDFIKQKQISNFHCDIFFSPKDILSGDSYSMRRLSQQRSLCFIIDGMGKGVSASVTAMMCCACINHLIDTGIDNSLEEILLQLIKFINPNLLDDEIISATFLLFDKEQERLYYALFAMPALLYTTTKSNEVLKIKSNNPPLTSYLNKVQIDEISTRDIVKLLCYSDGLNENTLKGGDGVYAQKLPEDFQNSNSMEELEAKRAQRITQQEDDITYMFFTAVRENRWEEMLQKYKQDDFLHNLQNYSVKLVEKKTFATSLEDIDVATQWYDTLLHKYFSCTEKESNMIGITFLELFMNAYEHGNLAIDVETKQSYLQNDIYLDKLHAMEQKCKKTIFVEVYKITSDSICYIATQICDEGAGFDTQSMDSLYKNTAKFNGRGIYLSRQNSVDLRYNETGNCVLFFSRCKK